MEQQLLQIRDQQKITWNKFSPGWKKWDELTMDFLKPYGDEMIRQMDLKDTDVVLDIASGTGEPALTIATKLKNGKVILSDLADDMLVIAHEKAEHKGIKNIEFSACDVSELPFEDDSFDAISCRFGFMFFPDMHIAAKEIVRVLKPGGKIAIAVWNVSEKNFWITAVMDSLHKNMDLPKPPPGSPEMFRCAKDGFMVDLLSKAGLKNLSQIEMEGKLKCKTTDVYWEFMTETPAIVANAMSKADTITKTKVKSEVYQAVNQRYTEGNVMVDANALIISGEK